MRDKIKLFFIFWTFGLSLWLVFIALRLTKRVKISGYNRKKLEPGENGLILVSNHPSLWEPLLLPLLFFPRGLFSLRFISYSTPDKKNYYDKWWFFFFRPVCLPIERGNPRKEFEALAEMKKILGQGNVLILFAEGGRTFKGEEFKFSLSGRKKIRKFALGLRKLFCNGGVKVLPVWTEGGERVFPNKDSFPRFPHISFPRFWRQTIIRIGEPLDLSVLPPETNVIEFVGETLLEIGDR